MLGEELNVAEFRRSAGENGSAFVDRLLDERMAPNLGSDLPIVRPFGQMCTSPQLQYRRTLARAKACQQNYLTAGEFERVVMLTTIIQIDLSEARYVFPQLFVWEESEYTTALDIAVEHHLGSGEQADRHTRLFYRRKSSGDQVHELARDEFVADFCRKVRYVLQALVAHAGMLLLVAPVRKLDAGIEAELP
jgi:hypothetical protein